MSDNIFKNFDLKNKTAVLTGSAGRLGNEFAHILCQAGANVILVDIDSKVLTIRINNIITYRLYKII